MLCTTYYVKARMTGNLKSQANLPVNPLTCQLVNLKFRQRVDFITRVTLFCAFCFRSLGFQQR